MADAEASLPGAGAQEDLTEPLLPVTAGVTPGQRVVPVIRVVESVPTLAASEAAGGMSLAVSIVITAKTILGAGMAALPKAFSILGLGFATGFLLLVGFQTHFSIEALTLGSLVTGSLSYPGVVRELLGKVGSVVLELCLISRCAGLMVVYVIVAADILAGGKGEGGTALPGLLCDWTGDSGGWCSDRTLVAGVILVAVLLPLCSPKRLASTAITSYLGLFSVGVWGVVTLILATAAEVRGMAHHMDWAPDWEALGDSPAKIATQLLAVIPVLATAYTCQMTVHFVIKEQRPFSQARMTVTSISAVTICTVLFLAVAVGSYAVFGASVPADVLENFSHSALAPVVGSTWATVFYNLVRLGVLISILANFPMQMWPYRESFSRLFFGRELQGPAFYVLTYLSLLAFYLVALVSGSIFLPIQIVGASAGALIAFFFPAFIALRACSGGHRGPPPAGSPRYWRWNAWGLIVLGVVQCVTGLGAIFIKPAGGQNMLGLVPLF